MLGQIELAQERGLLATGYVGDMASLAPDTVLASMVWDTAELLRPMIADVQAGTFAPAKYYSVGVAEDGLLVVINPELADRDQRRGDGAARDAHRRDQGRILRGAVHP